jgi:hypothetical protein
MQIRRLVTMTGVGGALLVAAAVPATASAASSCSNSKGSAITTVNGANGAAANAIRSGGRKGLAKSKSYTFRFTSDVCSATLNESDKIKGKKGGNKAFGNATKRLSGSLYIFPVTVTLRLTSGGVNTLKGKGKVTITVGTSLSGSFGKVSKSSTVIFS